MGSLKLGDLFPDFHAETNTGPIQFHNWVGNSWAILFSHPADFTPVCTTELARAAALAPEFAKRNVKLIALSCDSAEAHNGWIPDIISYGQQRGSATGQCFSVNDFPFPIIADEKRELANRLGMLDPDERDSKGVPLTARAVFIVDPAKRLKLSILYPATTGRNFDEILRVVDSLQLTSTKKVATPVDWKHGGDCMVLPTLSSDEATQLFGDKIKTLELPSGKHYLRLTPMPE